MSDSVQQSGPKFPSLRGNETTRSANTGPLNRNQAHPSPSNNQSPLQASPRNNTLTKAQATSSPQTASPQRPARANVPTPPAPRQVTPAPQIRAVALYDYDAIDALTVSFQKGEEMIVLEKEYDEWWRIDLNGKIGLAPANYIQEKADTLESKTNQSRLHNKRKSINAQRASTVYAALSDPFQLEKLAAQEESMQ